MSLYCLPPPFFSKVALTFPPGLFNKCGFWIYAQFQSTGCQKLQLIIYSPDAQKSLRNDSTLVYFGGNVEFYHIVHNHRGLHKLYFCLTNQATCTAILGKGTSMLKMKIFCSRQTPREQKGKKKSDLLKVIIKHGRRTEGEGG